MHKSNNWRANTDGSAAHKLLSIELDHHREIQSLLREIKRLRSEVGLMARQRNFHKTQTDRLADILRKLPPPSIPTRDTPKVADPPNPQNDTIIEERGRPRSREGNRSDKPPSREDGKKRTSQNGRDKEVDEPMKDGITHTIGEARKKTRATSTIRGSRTRTPSVASSLRSNKFNGKTPNPLPKKDLEKAKQARRKDKEIKRANQTVTEGPRMRETTRLTKSEKKKIWDEGKIRLEELYKVEESKRDTKAIVELTARMNEIFNKWYIENGRVRFIWD